MVARDGIEPPTPAFSDHKQRALPTTYKSRETAEVLGKTYKLIQLLTGIAGGISKAGQESEKSQNSQNVEVLN